MDICLSKYSVWMRPGCPGSRCQIEHFYHCRRGWPWDTGGEYQLSVKDFWRNFIIKKVIDNNEDA
jgi:hypothetical protein